MFKSSRLASLMLAIAFITVPAVASTQAAKGASGASTLKVGDMAPDFSITTVTSNGVTPAPFKLSEHRGETVVLAFFPKARTAGCTVQMESYRDRYQELFRNGEKVTLLAISVDPDTALISWAKDAGFQFRFGTDMDRAVGKIYAASNGEGFHKRFLYVIDPQGRISWLATPFNQMSADAYTDLGKAVADAAHRN